MFKDNDRKIDKITIERNEYKKIHNENVNKLELESIETQTTNKTEDSQIIILFIVIAVCGEMIILIGIYFREYFEYKLFKINEQKYEKIRLKKDRYGSILSYVYDNGKLDVGAKVISVIDLKTQVATKSTIPNPNQFVPDFVNDMDKLGIFIVNGKKRTINKPLEEAINIIENLDDTLQILENIK